MAFELGKTANGAKYATGQNRRQMYFTQAVIHIRQELIEGDIKNTVYIVRYGMEPVYCGLLDDLMYMGIPVSSDPETAIDFFRSEGWIDYGDSGTTTPETTIFTKDFDIDFDIESGASLPITLTFSELQEGVPYSVSFAGVPLGLSIHWTVSTTGFIDVEFTNTSPSLIPFHNTITITVKK